MKKTNLAKTIQNHTQTLKQTLKGATQTTEKNPYTNNSKSYTTPCTTLTQSRKKTYTTMQKPLNEPLNQLYNTLKNF